MAPKKARRMAKQQRTHDDPKQSKRFIEAAREAEADETKRGADRAFVRLTKPGAKKSRR
jgi:hypothetical protein